MMNARWKIFLPLLPPQLGQRGWNRPVLDHLRNPHTPGQQRPVYVGWISTKYSGGRWDLEAPGGKRYRKIIRTIGHKHQLAPDPSPEPSGTPRILRLPPREEQHRV